MTEPTAAPLPESWPLSRRLEIRLAVLKDLNRVGVDYQLLAEAAAALAQRDGIPREPTPEMIAAVRDVDLVAIGWEGGLRQIWRDMFDSALREKS